MGVVYRAHDTVLNRPVAVKVLNTTGLGTAGKARLLAEARAAAKLNHPNIVVVHDAGEADGTPFTGAIERRRIDRQSLIAPMAARVPASFALHDLRKGVEQLTNVPAPLGQGTSGTPGGGHAQPRQRECGEDCATRDQQVSAQDSPLQVQYGEVRPYRQVLNI